MPTRSSTLKSGARWWLLALCVCGAALSTASYADESKHRGNDGKLHHAEWSQGRHFDRRHDNRHFDRRHDNRHLDRRHERRHDSRHEDRRNWDRHDRRERAHGSYVRRFDGQHRHAPHDYSSRRDWHYYGGRYWAPARYRGRPCNDFRHFRGVHYHVAVRDYYDYYYPRYRFYGPRPLGANASVIISVPLF